MDSSSPWGLSEDYEFIFNDEGFPPWGHEQDLGQDLSFDIGPDPGQFFFLDTGPDPAQLLSSDTSQDPSQFLSIEIDPGQMSLPLPAPPFKHSTTPSPPKPAVEKSSDRILNGYLLPNLTLSPMATPLPIPANGTSSKGSSLRDQNSTNQRTPPAITLPVVFGSGLANATKRKLEDSIHVFTANPNIEVTRRKRKTFSISRKAEVALTRKVGACVQCKKRKEAVSLHIQPLKTLLTIFANNYECHSGDPCLHCETRFGSLELAQEICIRQDLVATRFDNLKFGK